TALAAGRRPPREPEELPDSLRESERVMLALRLDEPLPLAGIEHALDPAGLQRVERLGLVRCGDGLLELTDRGRFLGDAVTAALLAQGPAYPGCDERPAPSAPAAAPPPP